MNQTDKTKNNDKRWFSALRMGNVDAVRDMIREGYSPFVSTNDGYESNSFVVVCEYNGDIDILNLLLEHGVDPKKPNKNGQTPFMYLCQLGKIESVKWMFEKIDDVYEKDIYKNSAFMYACSGGNMETIEFLFPYFKDFINDKTDNGETALIKTVRKNKIEAVKFLLKQGANVNLQEHGNFANKGNSAFSTACSYAYTDIALLLLENGAFINAVNDDNQTGFELYMRNDEENLDPEFIERIVERIEVDKLEEYLEKDNGLSCLLKHEPDKNKIFLQSVDKCKNRARLKENVENFNSDNTKNNFDCFER